MGLFDLISLVMCLGFAWDFVNSVVYYSSLCVVYFVMLACNSCLWCCCFLGVGLGCFDVCGCRYVGDFAGWFCLMVVGGCDVVIVGF